MPARMIRLRAHQGDDNDSKEKWDDDYDDKERRLAEFKVIPEQTHLGRINSTTNTRSFPSHHPCIKTEENGRRADGQEEMKRHKTKRRSRVEGRKERKKKK